MKTGCYSSQDKFGIWARGEEYPDIGTSDFMEENYNHILSLPETGEIEYPVIKVYEINSKAAKDLPIFVCVFLSFCYWQPVILESIIDLFCLINDFSNMSENLERKHRSLKLLRKMRDDSE